MLPGPSGVVDYRLRDPTRSEKSIATIGLDPFLQSYVDVNLRHRSDDEKTSYSIGIGLVGNLSDAQGGQGGHSILLAGGLRRDFGPVRARLFFGEYQYTRPGQFRISPSPEALPARIERRKELGQSWAVDEGQRRIAGVLVDWGEEAPFGAGATLVFSQEDPSRGFTQIFSDFTSDGSVRAQIIANPQQRSTSWSGELRTHRRWSSEKIDQRLDLTIRGRNSRAIFGGSQVVNLGRVAFGDRPAPSVGPNLTSASANLRDAVDQVGVGITYRAVLQERFRVNVGLLRTDYRKTFQSSDGTSQTSSTAPWLYNIAAQWRVTPKLAFYGCDSRGLEEAGVAPSSANNRNQVLDAIIVTQRELGIRYGLSKNMALVVAGFDTAKPYVGIDGITGNFGPLGQVRHRGVEMSLAGRLRPNVSIVTGGVWIDPEISGAVLQQRRIGNRPVAVPRWRAIANADYQVPRINGLSLDVGATYIGERPVRSALSAISSTQLLSKASLNINLGARYHFQIGARDLTLRAQVLNLFDDYSWDVNSSETLSYNPSRRIRLALTAPF